MGVVTPIFVIGILVVIIFMAGCICYFSNPDSYQGSRLHIFITTLSSLAIFVTFLFYYSVVDLQMQQRREVKVRETSRITNLIQNTFIENIKENGDKIPKFTKELLPLQKQIKYQGKNKSQLDEDDEEDDADTYVNNLAKYTLSYKIFNLWQDIIVSHNFLDIDQENIIFHCLQRASSPQLRYIWGHCKQEFGDKTQIFGDLLFEKAQEIEKRTNEEYINKSKEICKCKIHKKIFPSI